MSTKVKYSPVDAGCVRQVKLPQIVVPNYQRDNTQRSAGWVANPDTFNPFLLEPITLAPHDGPLMEGDSMLVPGNRWAEPLFDLVDGLQRCTGLLAQFGQGTQVLARVIAANRSQQVEVFVGLNRGRVRVSDFWIFKANLADGNAGAIALNKIITENKFTVSKSSGKTTVASIKQYERLLGLDKSDTPTEAGMVALDKAFKTVNEMWLPTPGNKQRGSSPVVVGLARVYLDTVFEKNGESPTVAYIVQRLRKGVAGQTRSVIPGDIIDDAANLRRDGATLGGGDQITLAASKAILAMVNAKTSRNRLVWRSELAG